MTQVSKNQKLIPEKISEGKKLKFTQIEKRDGRIVPFDLSRITKAIKKALVATDQGDGQKAAVLSREVLRLLNHRFKKGEIPKVEQIQDIVEEVLISKEYVKTAKAYILYREQRRMIREGQTTLDKAIGLVDKYVDKADWRIKENSNMGFSIQGLHHYITSNVAKNYWLNKIYPEKIRQAAIDGDFHIHDLDFLGAYCCGWDLQDLLLRGFGGVFGKVECSPPKHLRSALGQMVNFFYTLQGESAGAQAFSDFDALLAPFIRYDNLDYRQVKQAVQEFIYNCAIPTRVGFQCLSEDTEILGIDGWKKYNEIKEGSMIATFNVKGEFIEYLPVKHIFAKKYKGKMYNLKNRISDQLISPKHKVVRKKFSSGGYVLEKIENVLKLKSPFMIPVGSEGNIKGDVSIDENIIKLIAWVVSEGTLDKNGRGDGRVSIYQSKIKNSSEYDEIITICHNLGLDYTERTQQGLGDDCNVIRFNADSSRKILNYFNSNKEKGIKFIPEIILNLDVESSRLFLETYIRGDGYDSCKIVTTSKTVKDGLLQVIVNAGYGATVLVRKPDNDLSKKDRYIIRIIKHRDTYINEVKEIEYEGVIWSPNTDNETVIAKRNGKIFITGNTPFTNITLDLKPPSYLKDQPVIIGGKPQKETYGEFQEEMNMINRAFCEVMTEGDAKGRVFTFPIPTINITKDFDWDNPNYQPIWEMTAKYGIPYFSNFVNSDMSPDDARSMCCRLRLDNRELRKRGGGLFGSNPLTGSVGVVTINLPRIGYLSKTKKEFFQRLEKLMDLAKESLEIKRKAINNFSEKGLYPYSVHYLSGIKKIRGSYWGNHFSTIGLIGTNEALVNFIGQDIGSKDGLKLAIEIMDFMREKLIKYQEETGSLYNLEATPAEGTAYSLARLDKKKYPDIFTAGTTENPYYTNSTQLPVNYTDDLFEALKLQDPLQSRYTGGTVFHAFLGERISDWRMVPALIKKAFSRFTLPYFSLTPTFSICPVHGYLPGEHFTCPKCVVPTKCEVYSRVVGYLRPVQQWNEGKNQEYEERKTFKI